MKTYGGVNISLQVFFTWALDGALHPHHFILGEKFLVPTG
jgi:hypothetical protein